MSAKVGQDVESICSKCGDVWHVVVAKVGDQIVKVHCKECHREHRYKPPGGAKPGASASAPRAPRSPGAARAKKAPPADEPLVAMDPTRPGRAYRSFETYSVGDKLIHPTFGTGVVEALAGPGKIQVFFASGRKVLAVGRTPAGDA